MTSERRRSPRFGSNLFANVRLPQDIDSIGRGVVVDVSLSGFGLDTELDLEIDKSYEFDVEVPITFQARVVRRLSSGQMRRYGVRIEGQGFIGKILLKRLLKGNRKSLKF